LVADPHAAREGGTDRKVVDVAVGVLVRADGAFLLTSRPTGKPYAGYWEFPGGKLEAGETVGQALARELHEELGVRAQIGREVSRYEHNSAGRGLVLLFHTVDAFEGEPASLAFEEIRWESPANLPQYDFLDGDLDFVKRIARGQVSFE
jgi:8-oxo-dGTP diphosphatase